MTLTRTCNCPVLIDLGQGCNRSNLEPGCNEASTIYSFFPSAEYKSLRQDDSFKLHFSTMLWPNFLTFLTLLSALRSLFSTTPPCRLLFHLLDDTISSLSTQHRKPREKKLLSQEIDHVDEENWPYRRAPRSTFQAAPTDRQAPTRWTSQRRV